MKQRDNIRWTAVQKDRRFVRQTSSFHTGKPLRHQTVKGVWILTSPHPVLHRQVAHPITPLCDGGEEAAATRAWSSAQTPFQQLDSEKREEDDAERDKRRRGRGDFYSSGREVKCWIKVLFGRSHSRKEPFSIHELNPSGWQNTKSKRFSLTYKDSLFGNLL